MSERPHRMPVDRDLSADEYRRAMMTVLADTLFDEWSAEQEQQVAAELHSVSADREQK